MSDAPGPTPPSPKKDAPKKVAKAKKPKAAPTHAPYYTLIKEVGIATCFLLRNSIIFAPPPDTFSHF